MDYVGCSGFMYDHWRGNFYPERIPKSKWFQYYFERFTAVELNVTFYRLPKIETFRKWKDTTPKDCAFALKGSRFITHVKRLSDVSEAVERFFKGALELGRKLEVVLWQFPPNFTVHMERFGEFIRLLNTYKVRNVFEFRNESWLCNEVIEILKRSGYSFCSADWPEFLKDVAVTADYFYIRKHGHEGNYDTFYSNDELRREKRIIQSLHKKGAKDVFIFFNNDYRGYAPQNAMTLRTLLGQI